MRSALLVVVALASIAVVGCGDAGPSTSLQRRTSPNPNPSTIGGGVTDDEETEGEDTPDPGNPNATTPPAPPSTPGQAVGELGVTLSSATPAVDLGEELELTVTVEPKSGFKGDADLTATGLPAGITATFMPAKVTLNTTPVTAKLLIKVPVNAVPSAPGASSPLVVTATSAAVPKPATANASFKVNPKLKLVIPVNIDALRSTGTKFLDQWGTSFGANPQPLLTQTGNGIVVTVFNADSKQHIVHGNNGFAHGSTTAGQEIKPNAFEMQNGAPRTRTLNPGANVNGYPHEGGAGASAGFRIQVSAAP